MKENEAYDKAIKEFWFKDRFSVDGTEIQLVLLLSREENCPLNVPWWHGKQVSIMAVDVSGNFVLRHCDGTVRYWRHDIGKDYIIAKSIKEFSQGLYEAK